MRLRAGFDFESLETRLPLTTVTQDTLASYWTDGGYSITDDDEIVIASGTTIGLGPDGVTPASSILLKAPQITVNSGAQLYTSGGSITLDGQQTRDVFDWVTLATRGGSVTIAENVTISSNCPAWDAAGDCSGMVAEAGDITVQAPNVQIGAGSILRAKGGTDSAGDGEIAITAQNTATRFDLSLFSEVELLIAALQDGFKSNINIESGAIIDGGTVRVTATSGNPYPALGSVSDYLQLLLGEAVPLIANMKSGGKLSLLLGIPIAVQYWKPEANITMAGTITSTGAFTEEDESPSEDSMVGFGTWVQSYAQSVAIGKAQWSFNTDSSLNVAGGYLYTDTVATVTVPSQGEIASQSGIYVKSLVANVAFLRVATKQSKNIQTTKKNLNLGLGVTQINTVSTVDLQENSTLNAVAGKVNVLAVAMAKNKAKVASVAFRDGTVGLATAYVDSNATVKVTASGTITSGFDGTDTAPIDVEFNPAFAVDFNKNVLNFADPVPFKTGDRLYFSSSDGIGTIPGLVPGQSYYAITNQNPLVDNWSSKVDLNNNQLQLATSPGLAQQAKPLAFGLGYPTLQDLSGNAAAAVPVTLLDAEQSNSLLFSYSQLPGSTQPLFQTGDTVSFTPLAGRFLGYEDAQGTLVGSLLGNYTVSVIESPDPELFPLAIQLLDENGHVVPLNGYSRFQDAQGHAYSVYAADADSGELWLYPPPNEDSGTVPEVPTLPIKNGDPLIFYGGLINDVTNLVEAQTYYAIVDPETPGIIRLAATPDQAAASNPAVQEAIPDLLTVANQAFLTSVASSFAEGQQLSQSINGDGSYSLWSNANQGTFTMTVSPPPGQATTAAIPFNASAAELQEALNAITGLVTTVSGSGSSSDPWIIAGKYQLEIGAFEGSSQIVFNYAPNLSDGTAVVYQGVPGKPIGGLTSGQVYYIWNQANPDLVPESPQYVVTLSDSAATAVPALEFSFEPSMTAADGTSYDIRTVLPENGQIELALPDVAVVTALDASNLTGGSASFGTVPDGSVQYYSYATSGTLTFSVTQDGATQVTAPLAWNATASEVQAALNALAGVDVRVFGTGAYSAPWTIAGLGYDAISSDSSKLFKDGTNQPLFKQQTSEMSAVATDATGGSFVLEVSAGGNTWQTQAIAADADASDVANALNALSGLRASVSGAGTADSPWMITAGYITLQPGGALVFHDSWGAGPMGLIDGQTYYLASADQLIPQFGLITLSASPADAALSPPNLVDMQAFVPLEASQGVMIASDCKLTLNLSSGQAVNLIAVLKASDTSHIHTMRQPLPSGKDSHGHKDPMPEVQVEEVEDDLLKLLDVDGLTESLREGAKLSEVESLADHLPNHHLPDHPGEGGRKNLTDITASPVVVRVKNDIGVVVTGTARIKATGSVMVRSKLEEMVHGMSSATITKPKANRAEGAEGSDKAVAIGLNVVILDNTSQSLIAPNAQVTGGSGVRVDSAIEYPFVMRETKYLSKVLPDDSDPTWPEQEKTQKTKVWENFMASGKMLRNLTMKHALGVGEWLFNYVSNAAAAAKAGHGEEHQSMMDWSITGSISMVDITNTNLAQIADGAQINQDTTVPAKPVRGVTILAETLMTQTGIAGSVLPHLNLIGVMHALHGGLGELLKMNGGGTANATGGSVFWLDLQNTTQALLGGAVAAVGVTVDPPAPGAATKVSFGTGWGADDPYFPKGLWVEATNKVADFLVVESGSAAAQFGLEGSFAYLGMGNDDPKSRRQVTKAILSAANVALILNAQPNTQGDVEIKAADDARIWLVSGAILAGAPRGIGLSGSVVELGRDLAAGIGTGNLSDSATNRSTFNFQGNVSIEATADGIVVPASLVGAYAPNHTKRGEGEDHLPGEGSENAASSTEGHWGLDASGDFAGAFIDDQVDAWLVDLGTFKGASGASRKGLSVVSENTTNTHAASGSASLTLESGGGGATVGASGSAATIVHQSSVEARVANVTLSNLDVNVAAENRKTAGSFSGGMQVAVVTGIDVNVAGSVAVNKITNITHAILESVTTALLGETAVEAVSADEAWSAAGMVSVEWDRRTVGSEEEFKPKTMVGVGASAAVNELTSDTLASVNESTLELEEGACEVVADDFTRSFVLSAGVDISVSAGIGVSIGGMFSTTVLRPSTQALVSGSSITNEGESAGDDLEVAATFVPALTSISGYVSLEWGKVLQIKDTTGIGVGVGAAVVVTKVESDGANLAQTVAGVSDSEIDWNAGDVVVNAYSGRWTKELQGNPNVPSATTADTDSFYALAIAGSGQGEHGAVSVGVTVVGAVVETTLDLTTQAAIEVPASNTGLAVGTNLLSVHAEEGFEVEQDAGGATLAQQGAPQSATSVGVAIGGAWNGWTSTNEVNATISAGDATGNGEATFEVAELSVMATLSTLVDQLSFGVAVDVGYSAGITFAASLSGATLLFSMADKVTASLTGGVTTSLGAVTVSAVDESQQTLRGGAGSLAVSIGEGVSVGLAPSAVWANAEVANTITALIGSDGGNAVSTDVSAAGPILVEALNSQQVQTLVTAVAVSVALSTQSVALSGSGAESSITATNQVTAQLGTQATVTSTMAVGDEAAVTVAATDEADLEATVGSGAFSLAWYGGSIGVSLAEIDITDVVQAVVDGSTVTTAGGTVAVTAEGHNTVNVLSVPTSLSITLGVSAAGGNANITDSSTFDALVTGGSSVNTGNPSGEAGDLEVVATGEESLTANISGGSGGVGSIGGFVSRLARHGSTTATIEEVASLDVGDLTLQALSNHSLLTTGYVVTIGGLVGAGEKHTLEFDETIEATLSGQAGSTGDFAGNVNVSAECTTTALSEDNGALNIGGLAGGGYVSDSSYEPVLTVSMVSLDMEIEGRLTVSATVNGSNQARAIAGSGGGGAAEASLVTMETNPKASLTLGEGRISAADITLLSSTQMDYDAYADSIMAAIVGYSGAVINHTANPGATIELQSGAELHALHGAVNVSTQIDLQRVANEDDHDGVMVRLGSGGAAGVYGGGIQSNFSPSSNVLIDDQVLIDAKGDLLVTASQRLAMQETASINAGGLVAGSVTRVNMTATPDTGVTVGENVTLRSAGDIGMGTFVNAAADSIALSSMWGLAAGGGSEAGLDFTADQSIDVAQGTRIEAAGDVRLLAGIDPRTGQVTQMNGMAYSVSTSKGLIVIPVANGDAQMKANATLSLAPTTATSGGGDVYLVAQPGTNETYEYIQTRWDGLLGNITSQAGELDNSSNMTLDGSVRAGGLAKLDIEVVPSSTAGGAPTLTVNGTSFAANGAITPNNATSEAFAPFTAGYNPSYLPDLSGVAPATAVLLASSVSSSPVTQVTLTDLSALGGQVVVVADTLAGAGSLQAAIPLVTITNPTSAYLNLDGLQVNGGPTVGQVVLQETNGTTLAKPAQLQILPNATGVSTASVVIEQTYDAAVGTGTTSGPAVFVTAPIGNSIGSVTLQNSQGAVVDMAPINAVSVTISTPNSAFILDTPNDYYGAAGNILDAWDATVQPWSSTSSANSSYVPNYANPGRAFMPGRVATGTDPNLAATAAADYLYNASAASYGPGSRTLNSSVTSLNAFAENTLYLDGYSKGRSPSNNQHGQETSVIVFGNSIPFWNTGQNNNFNWNSTDTHESAIGATNQGSGGFLQNSFYQFANLYNDTGADNGGVPYVLPDQPIFASAPLSTVNNELTGGLTAAQVGITARVIDMNGPLNVGSSRNFEIELPASLASTLATFRSNYLAGKSGSSVYTIDLGPAATAYTATYDAVANQITLNPIATSASQVNVLLEGQIISTTTQGGINMIGGPGIGSVRNGTGIPLVIEGIDAGSLNVTGTVEIRDTLQNQTVRYEYQPGNPVQVYTVAGTNPTDYGTPVASASVEQTYTPPSGLLQYERYRMALTRTLGFSSSGNTGNDYSNVSWTNAGTGMWQFDGGYGTWADFGHVSTVDAAVSPDNTSVTLTNPSASPAISVSAVWMTQKVNLDSDIDIQFTYQASGNKAADGMALVFQNQGSTAIGAVGGGLGYSGISTNSAAYQMNLYAPNTVGTNFSSGGSAGGYQATNGVNIASGNPILVQLHFDAIHLTLTETLTEVLPGGPSAPFSRTYTNVNLSNALGSSTSYVGFTGSYGGATSIQTVSDFQMTSKPVTGLTTATAAGVTLPGTDGFLEYLTAVESQGVDVKYTFDWHGSGPPWGMGDNTPWVYHYPTRYDLAIYSYVKADNPISISFASMKPGNFTIATDSDLIIDGLIRNAGEVSLVAGGNIQQTLRGAIEARNVSLVVDADEGAIGSADQPLSVLSVDGAVTAIAPQGVYLDSPGPLTVNTIAATPVVIAGFAAGEADWSFVSGNETGTFGNLSGFAGFVPSTSGLISPDNGTLTLTNNQPMIANAAWYNQRVPTSSFVADFQYQASGNSAADGIAFVLQNAGTNAVGGLGGNLGYVGIPGQAVAYEMNLWAPNTTGTNFVTASYAGVYKPTESVNIASGVPVHVELAYDALGQTLTETLTQGSNQYVHTYLNVDLGRLLGDAAYMGFTGATGAAVSTQVITNFRFRSVIPEVFGNNLLAIPSSGVPNQASASWYKTPVSLDQDFHVGFVYGVESNGNPADGLALVFQNQGLSAIGGVVQGTFQGNSLGYAGIPGPSAAYEINVFGGNSSLPRGTAVAINGTIGPYVATGSVDISAGHPVQVDLYYDAATGTLVESLADLVTGATYRATHSIQLADVLGSNSALIGFTAANGAAFSKQLVSDFLFSYGDASTADVVISAKGPMVALSGSSIVHGETVTLTSSGGIGTSGAPLSIQLDAQKLANGAIVGGVINVQAVDDVFLAQSQGDMRVGRIVSTSGIVSLETSNGSIEDGLTPDAAGLGSPTLSKSTRNRINQLLKQSGDAPAETTVVAYEQMINRYYWDYWYLAPNGTVEDDTFVVNEAGIANLEPVVAQVLGVETATDAQVQDWANTTWQSCVTSFASTLAFGPDWSTLPQFVTYDANYQFQASPSTQAQLTANSESLTTLVGMLSLAALKAANSVTDGTDVNIQAHSVSLNASQSIGQHETPTFIPLADLNSANLTEHEKELIATASQAGELRMVGTDPATGATIEYDYLDPPAGVTPTGVMVYLSRSVRTDIVTEAVSNFDGFVPSGSGVISADNDTLTLTNNQFSVTNAAWYGEQVPTTGFVVSFQYQAGGNRKADGIAFVLQNQGTNALGGGGGFLGYVGIPGQTVAYEMNLYSPQTVGTNFVTTNTSGIYHATNGVNISSGVPVDVQLVYDNSAKTLTETLMQGANVFTSVYSNVDLPSLLGNQAYVGFTGASGGAVATQTVTNFRFVPSTSGTLTAVAGQGDVLVTEESGDLAIDGITAGGTVRLVTNGDLFAVPAQNGATQAISGTDVTLTVGGAVGSANAPLLMANSGLVDAEVIKDLFLAKPVGDLQLGQLQAGGDVSLTAAGSIVNGVANGKPNVIGDNLSMTSSNGGIGSVGQPLLVSLVGALTASADQSIYVNSFESDLTVNSVVSTAGDVVLDPPGGMYSLILLENGSIHALQGDVTLQAQQDITLPSSSEVRARNVGLQTGHGVADGVRPHSTITLAGKMEAGRIHLLGGPGNDHVLLGSDGISPGTLERILGQISFEGGGGADAVYLDDRLHQDSLGRPLDAGYHLTENGISSDPQPNQPARLFSSFLFDASVLGVYLLGTQGRGDFRVSLRDGAEVHVPIHGATVTLDRNPGEAFRIRFHEPAPQGQIQLDKRYTGIVNDADGSGDLSVGDTIGYAFDVSNPTQLRLFNVLVDDPMLGASQRVGSADTLAPGAATTYYATYTVQDTDLDQGVVVNQATARAMALGHTSVSMNDTLSVPVVQHPALQLQKAFVGIAIDADASGTISLGDTLEYSLAVTNTGDVTLERMVVSDIGASVIPPANGDGVLSPGETVSYSAMYQVTQADVDAGQVLNTAQVTAASLAGNVAADTDQVTVAVPVAPALVLKKTVTLTSDVGQSGVSMNDTLTYRFEVINLGNQTLHALRIEDPLPGLGVVAIPDGPLAPGASVTAVATYVVTKADAERGFIRNVAKALASPPGTTAADVYDADLATISVQSPGTGCPADFWRLDAERHGADSWPVGFSTEQGLSTVFEHGAGITLLPMLRVPGDGVNRLLRQGVAAVLNAAHPDIHYPMTRQQVVDAVNAARASGDAVAIQALSDQLAAYNGSGCGIDLHQDQPDPLPLIYGDANMDGAFDSADLVHLFQLSEYEDQIAFNSHWGTGDWDGDGDFTTSDFVLAFQQGLYEEASKAAARVASLDESAIAAAMDRLYEDDGFGDSL